MSAPSHPGAIDVNGLPYLRDAKGNLVPLYAQLPFLFSSIARPTPGVWITGATLSVGRSMMMPAVFPLLALSV